MEALADLGISGLVRSPERFVRLLDVKVRPPLTRRPRPNVCPTFPISSDTRQSTCSSCCSYRCRHTHRTAASLGSTAQCVICWLQTSTVEERADLAAFLCNRQHQMVLPIAKEILQPKDGRGQDVAFLTLWLGACP
jgi:hypothetical protein